MAEKNLACPTTLSTQLNFPQIQSYFAPATALKDGDSVVHLSDIDPEHSYLSSLFSHYSQFFSEAQEGGVIENEKIKAIDSNQQARAQLAKKLWMNFQELHQKLAPSTFMTIAFSSVRQDASSQLITSLWHLLKCQYGNDLQKIFPEKKLGGVAVIAGDSSVTQELNELLKTVGYRGNMGFVDVENLDPTTPGFYPRILFANFFGLGTVHLNPESNVLIHRFLDLTFDDRFLSDPRPLDPLGAKLYASRASGFIGPPLQEEYSRNETHLDYLLNEFRKRMKQEKPTLERAERAPLFQIRAGANNSMASIIGHQPINFSKIRAYVAKLDQKTKSLTSEYPGILRVFTLPPRIPHLLLREIHSEDHLYNEDGKHLIEGYTIRSWFEEQGEKPKKVMIPKNMVFSKVTYETLEKEARELIHTLQESLEPLGWLVLDSSNETLDRVLEKGLSIDQMEGFGKVDLAGLGDFLTSDGLHPKPITTLRIVLGEAWELGQRGVMADFPTLGPDHSSEEIISEKFKNIVRENPSEWFSDLRMPMHKAEKLKEGLKTIRSSFAAFEDLVAPFWVYFERDSLVKFLKKIDADLDSVQFEEKALKHYLKLASKKEEKTSFIQDGKLQRHQVAHLIQHRMKGLSEQEKQNLLPQLIKIAEKEVEQKESNHSKAMKYSKFVLKGAAASPQGFFKHFYMGLRAEANGIVSLAETKGIGFSSGLGIEAGTRSIEKGSFIFLPLAATLWGRLQVLSTLPQPIGFQFALRLNTCQYLSGLRLSFCEGGEISSLLSLQKNSGESSLEMQKKLSVSPFVRAAFHPNHTLARFFVESSYLIPDQQVSIQLGFAH